MKLIVLCILLVFSSVAFSDGPFETKIVISQVEAITAKAASIESMSDTVAVFLVDPDPIKQLGLTVAIKSDAKFVVVRATAVGSTKQIKISTRQSGDSFFFAVPGKYAITIIESDPEKGIWFNDLEFEIQGKKTEEPNEPDKPIDPDNPDLLELSKIAKRAAIAVGDPKTQAALSQAYRSVLPQLDNVETIEIAKQIVTLKRQEVLRNRTDESLLKDWNVFLVAIAPEILKHTKSIAAYRDAVACVAESLN